MNPHHPLSPPVFPYPWASDWGEDCYGLWQAFTFMGIRHAFRWLPPGGFMMGSPPTEQGRFEDESLHPVTLQAGRGSSGTGFIPRPKRLERGGMNKCGSVSPLLNGERYGCLEL